MIETFSSLNSILFFGIIVLVVVKCSGNSILTIFRCFKFGTSKNHPDLGKSVLACNPLSDSKKWKFLGSVYGYPDIQQLKAVYHYNKTDNRVVPPIIRECPGLIKGAGWKDVTKGIELKN